MNITMYSEVPELVCNALCLMPRIIAMSSSSAAAAVTPTPTIYAAAAACAVATLSVLIFTVLDSGSAHL
jgi:hypothetical protein